tara:strand:+ start:282 stop:506 length:225 start_codon:yes stop_codon:yes gene_type:complete
MEQYHLLAVVGPHLVSVATRQVLSPLYSYNLILSTLKLGACSLLLEACSLDLAPGAIANAAGKRGPLLARVFYS